MFDQSSFDIRCEWGAQGVAHLAPISDVVIIVDVFSFSSCVEIAISRGAIVYPYPRRDESAAAFAAQVGALLAGAPGSGGFALSPQSLLDIPPGTRLVLPSPNGATLTLATGQTPTLAGCLRNYRAIALAAQRYGQRIAIIPAGERWPDGSLRPAFEDWVGAGAIISCLSGSLSPEARATLAAFQAAEHDMPAQFRNCASGQEHFARGLEANIPLVAAMNVSESVPVLKNGAYRLFI